METTKQLIFWIGNELIIFEASFRRRGSECDSLTDVLVTGKVNGK